MDSLDLGDTKVLSSLTGLKVLVLAFLLMHPLPNLVFMLKQLAITFILYGMQSKLSQKG